MYTVECDGLVFYDDISLLEDTVLISPKLELTDNAAGTFEMTVPPINRAYNKIKKVTSTICVKKNGEYIWSGRVMTETKDFYGRKIFKCEGALSYLSDVIILPKKYDKVSNLYSLLKKLLNDYNDRVTTDREIRVGTVTTQFTDLNNEFKIEYQTPLDFIQENLIDVYGGHLYISQNANNKLELNYISDNMLNSSTQTIDFGVNLLDFAEDYDFSKICTVCIPRGKQLQSNLSDQTDSETTQVVEEDYSNEYITVYDVNIVDGRHTYYVSNPTAVKNYGVVERVVDFNDIEDPMQLLNLAQTYISNLQFDNMKLTVKAVDLHMLNASVKSFNWLENVHCISIPHGMDRWFPIYSVNIPLDAPENIEYTLGQTAPVSASGNYATAERVSDKQIRDMATRESVLVPAKKYAKAILDRKTTGYVEIVSEKEHSEALIIHTDKKNGWENSSQFWKFNINGLGFYSKGAQSTDNDIKIAITADGSIVADMITTGTMSADRIYTGVIKDVYNNNIIDLEHGKVFLNADKTVVRDKNNIEYHVATSSDIKDLNDKLATANESITSISNQQTTISTSLGEISTKVSSLEASYGTCTTASNAVIKNVKCPNFTLTHGSVIVVKFSYGNTADKPKLMVNGTAAVPILLNNRPLSSSSKSNWGNYQTVTFAYDGYKGDPNYPNGMWRMAEGAVESHIRQLADSISLSVKGSLGHTATIKLEADGGVVDESEIDMTAVREAFRDDHSAITISAGRVSFESGTFVLKAANCSIDANGTVTAVGAFRAGDPKGRRTELNAGQLRGYNDDNKICGYVAPGAATTWTDSGRIDKCLQLQANGVLRISATYIATSGSSNVDKVAIAGASTTIHNVVINANDGLTSYKRADLKFINGLLVSAPG